MGRHAPTVCAEHTRDVGGNRITLQALGGVAVSDGCAAPVNNARNSAERSGRTGKTAYRVIACLVLLLFAGAFYASCRSLLSARVGPAKLFVGMLRDPYLPPGPSVNARSRSWALSYRSGRSAYVIGVSLADTP